MATGELERIGAPSRVLGPAYRGIEYCRRLRDLGRRVVLAPRARMEISAQAADRLGSSPLPPTSKLQIRTEQRYRLSLASPGLASDVTTTSALRRAHARRNRLAKRTSTSHVAALFADADELAVQRRSMSGEAGQDGPAEVPTGGPDADA